MLLIGSVFLLLSFIGLGKKAYVKLEKKALKKEKEQLNAIDQKLKNHFVLYKPEIIKKRLRILILVGFLMSLITQSWIYALIAFILYIYLPFAWVYWIEKRRFRAFQIQLLQFFPFISSVLRAGHTIEKAIDQSCKNAKPPLSQEMDLVQKQMHIGQSFDQALYSLYQRMPDKNLKMALSAIDISRKTGSNLAEAIDYIATTIHEKEKLKSELKALTSQGRMQAWVTGCMPFVLVAGLEIISPGYLSPLYQTTQGKLAIVYCFVSLLLGIFWIYKIVNKEYL